MPSGFFLFYQAFYSVPYSVSHQVLFGAESVLWVLHGYGLKKHIYKVHRKRLLHREKHVFAGQSQE